MAKKRQRKNTSKRLGGIAGLFGYLNIFASGDPDEELQLTASDAPGIEIQAAAEGDEAALPSFHGTAYTGGQLDLPKFSVPVIVDLEGVEVGPLPRPALRDHKLEKIVGHAERVDIGRTIEVAGLISGTGDDAREVVANSKNGFVWRLSIGAMARRGSLQRIGHGELVEVNGRQFKGPCLVARKSRLNEISFTAVDADGRTSVRVAASQEEHEMEFNEWLRANGWTPEDLSDQQRTVLQAAWQAETEEGEAGGGGHATGGGGAGGTTVNASAGGESGVLNVEAAVEEYRLGRERVDRIHELTVAYPEIRASAFEHGWDAQRTELEVHRSRRPAGPAIHSEDGSGRHAETLEAALCLSAGLDEAWLGTQYDERTMNAAMAGNMRDTSLWVLMDTVIAASGGSTFFGNRKSTTFINAATQAEAQILASGGTGIEASTSYSTISLSGILGNVANKALLSAYEAAETVHQMIVAYRSHSDFKVHTRYRMTGTGGFKKIGPDGELKHIGVTESSFTNQLDTYGAIIGLTRTMIINDDLGAFTELPSMLGHMCAVKVEEAVFILLLGNSGTFFGAGNKNLLTGAGSVLGIDGMNDAEKLFGNQVDANKKPILTSPKLLLTGTALKTKAEQLYSQTQLNVTTTENKPQFAENPHANKYRPIISPYMNNTAIKDSDGKAIPNQSDTQWCLFADPRVRAAIAVATLNGNRRPFIERKEGPFDTLGELLRAYFDFGVGFEDPAGAVRSDGS